MLIILILLGLAAVAFLVLIVGLAFGVVLIARIRSRNVSVPLKNSPSSPQGNIAEPRQYVPQGFVTQGSAAQNVVPQLTSLPEPPWRELAWLTIPIVVLAGFGMLPGPLASVSAINRKHSALSPGLPSEVAVSTPVRQNVLPVSLTVSSSGDKESSLPKWCEHRRVVDGLVERIVLVSQQYSTRQEAEAELELAAIKLLETDLKSLQFGWPQPAPWKPTGDDVRYHALVQRHDEVIERDFGKFTHPMHRVWWQIELSPAVRTQFAPDIRRALISFRIWLIGAVISVVVMLASSSLVSFKLASRTQGFGGRWLTLIPFGLTTAWVFWLLVLMRSGSSG